jgi:N-acetylglucosaminyl-diphospho-decaprenol L-rhamnosyltransferase
VVAYGNHDRLAACLASLARQARAGLKRIILVDNNPIGHQCDLRDLTRVTAVGTSSADSTGRADPSQGVTLEIIATGENLGYGRAINAALERIDEEYVLVANPDLVMESGALDLLLGAVSARQGTAAAGPSLRTYDGAGPADAPLTLPTLRAELVGFMGASRIARRPTVEARDDGVEFLSGACFVARRNALAEIGGFDPRFFLYYEDADLFRRLRSGGWRLVFVPLAIVRHAHGGTWSDPVRRQAAALRGAITYYEKYAGRSGSFVYRVGLIGLYLPRLVLGGFAGRLLQMGTAFDAPGLRRRMIREVVRIAFSAPGRP